MECKHDNLVIEVSETRKGLYCSVCGEWLKWVGKDEFNKLRFRPNVRVIKYN